jgi:hypothetical protein
VYLKEDGTLEDDGDKLPPIEKGNNAVLYGKKGGRESRIIDDEPLVDPENETD